MYIVVCFSVVSFSNSHLAHGKQTPQLFFGNKVSLTFSTSEASAYPGCFTCRGSGIESSRFDFPRLEQDLTVALRRQRASEEGSIEELVEGWEHSAAASHHLSPWSTTTWSYNVIVHHSPIIVPFNTKFQSLENPSLLQGVLISIAFDSKKLKV